MSHLVGGVEFDYLPLDIDDVQARIRESTAELGRLRVEYEGPRDLGSDLPGQLRQAIKDEECQLGLLLQLQDLLSSQGLMDGIEALDEATAMDGGLRMHLRTTDAPKDKERDVELQVGHLTLRTKIGDFNALLAQRPQSHHLGIPVVAVLDPVIEDELPPMPRGA